MSNGNGTPQVLEYLRPHLDLYKVDLKSFDDRHYHELGGRIGPILDSIRRIHQMGLWLEIVTLLIPGFNDSVDELRRLTEFLAGISPDIPWHVTAFHTDYKMQGDGQPTPPLRICCAPPKSAVMQDCVTSMPAIFPAGSESGKTRVVHNAARL